MPIDALTPSRLAARLRRTSPEHSQVFRIPRPDGPVLWVHARGDLSAGPLLDLRNRMSGQMAPVTVVRTGTGPERETNLTTPGTVFSEPVPETLADIRVFLDHWTPDAGLWTGALEPPLLVDAAVQAKIPLFLANPELTPETARRDRKVERFLLDQFRVILASDGDQAQTMRDMQLGQAQIEKAGPFNDVQRPLKCNESDREEFAEALGTRPVWMALAPSDVEFDAILKAHAQAQRTTHRLLLVIVPEDDAQGPAMAEHLTTKGWRVTRRGADEMPGEAIEIYLADSLEEVGLWYRVAPLCFLGGSLSYGARRNPMEAAALGAALMAGPEGGAYGRALDRLDRAAALHRLSRADGIGRAVSDLIAPDRLAILVHRAWDVSTEGADVGDRLADLLVEAMVPNQSV